MTPRGRGPPACRSHRLTQRSPGQANGEARSYPCRSLVVVIVVSEAPFTADRITPFLAKLFSALFAPDLIALSLARSTRIEANAAGSDVDALSEHRLAGNGEQAGDQQPTGKNVFHLQHLRKFPAETGRRYSCSIKEKGDWS